MNLARTIRDPLHSVAVLTLVFGVLAAAAGLYANVSSLRLIAALGGTLLFVCGALTSGNPRLFCLWGLGISIPFLFAKTIGDVINKGGGEVAINVDVTDVFLGILALFIIRDLWTGSRPGLWIPRVTWFYVATMVLGIGTIIAGPYRSPAFYELFRMAKMLVLFLVLCHELHRPKRLLHLCGALTLGLLINAIVGLLEFYYRTTFGLADLGEASSDVIETLAATSLQGNEIWRVGAFLLHPNVFGTFLAVVLPLTMACLVLARGRLQKLYYLTAFLAGCGALVATYSRSGWLSFAVSFSCFMLATFAHSGVRRRSTAAAVLLGILFLGVLIGARDQITDRITNSKAEAVSFRGEFNNDAKRMIEEHPLWGLGLNTYSLWLPEYARFQYGSWPPPVHHTYYLWWAETGLVGLGLQLTMWAGIFWTGVRNFRVKDVTMFAINAACVVGLIAFALDGFVSFSLRITPTLKTFWAISAMIMAVHYWRLRNETVRAPLAIAVHAPDPVTMEMQP